MLQVKDPKSGQVLTVADTAPYLAKGWTVTTEQSTAGPTDNPTSQAYAIIDADQNLTPDEKALAKATVDAYSGGIEADASAILRTFDTLKQSTIDPHYADLVNQASYVLKQNVSSLEAQRQNDLEVERANAEETARIAQKNLETSGMLNTGEAVRQLGSEGAPVVPFGGGNIEGLVPKSNRLIATDTQNRYQENLRKEYNTAEAALGTAGVSKLIPAGSTVGGVTGTIPTARTTQLGMTLADVTKNVEAKRKLTSAQPNPVTPIDVK